MRTQADLTGRPFGSLTPKRDLFGAKIIAIIKPFFGSDLIHSGYNTKRAEAVRQHRSGPDQTIHRKGMNSMAVDKSSPSVTELKAVPRFGGLVCQN